MQHPIKGAITSEDVLGKDVIDLRGGFLGVSDKLFIHPKTLKVMGISVDKGFLRKGFLIGANHIREVTEYAVFLTIEPAFRLKGMLVFSADGKKVGTVTAVTLVPNSNTIKEVTVKSSLKGLGTIVLPAEYLARMEHNVFLSIFVDDLVALHSPKK